VEEGTYVSDEPAEVLDQQLELPNQDGALSEDIEQALIEKLAEHLGIDPKYISLNSPVNGASRQRALSGGLALKITILSDDSGALAATLAVLTSDPSFWQGVNNRIVENNATTTLDTSGIISFINVTCNEHFERGTDTGSCVAVPISCGVGTFAEAGTSQCVDCPAGKYSDDSGASTCKSCAPGSFGDSDGSASCVECAMTKFQGAQGKLKCAACPFGKYQNVRGQSFCAEVESLKSYLAIEDSTGKAVEISCPKAGMGAEVECGAGRLTFNPIGYFHDGLETDSTVQTDWAHRSDYTIDDQTVFYPCIFPAACAINKITGDLNCVGGTFGVLCASCQEGFFQEVDGSCKTCGGGLVLDGQTKFLIALAVFILLLPVTKPLAQRAIANKAEIKELVRATKLRWKKFENSSGNAMKLLLAFFQVILLLPNVYRIPFPSAYISVLSSFSVVNLDFLRLVRSECFMETNWHTRVYFMGAVCICCWLGTVSAFCKAEIKGKVGTVFRKVMGVLTVLGYFIYPSANMVFFQTFNCQQIDTAEYLRSDLGIECSDPTHRSTQVFAALMIMLFSFGLPALYLALLWPHKKGIVAQSGRARAALKDVKMLKFFYIDYKTEYFYWDVLECLRKLLLTGIAVLFVPGSMIQAAGSVAVIGVYMVAIASLKPYERARDNTLAIILYAMQATTMFVGLLLKMKDGYESSGKYDDGFSTDSMVAVLISTVVIVLLVGVRVVLGDLQRAYIAPLLRYRTGGVVILPTLEAGKDFDLFLSHAQNFGQDQVAVIKLTLENLLHGEWAPSV
jgi:hypothetical protein